jgi:mRNA-degrading endonuclease toxin of MazEF toxin-antitoxin module
LLEQLVGTYPSIDQCVRFIWWQVKIRPVRVLTRAIALPYLSGTTVAPITSTIAGLATKVRVGPRDNLDQDGVVH